MAKTKPLSPKEQIDLLTNIRNYISEGCGSSYICNVFFILYQYQRNPIYKVSTRLHDLVPLFTFENSKMFGGHKDKSGGWFGLYEVTKRVKFLNWIIEENKKLINQS